MATFRFGSPVAYGMLLSCFGGGALVGMLAAGSIRRVPREDRLLVGVMFVVGAALAGLGLVQRLLAVAALMAGMGVAAGLVNVRVMSRIQLSVPPEMLGRVMSVLMLSAVGLLPLSLVAAGLVAQAHLTAMFLAAGGIVLVSAVWMALAARDPRG
jgi:hypothetical protein